MIPLRLPSKDMKNLNMVLSSAFVANQTLKLRRTRTNILKRPTSKKAEESTPKLGRKRICGLATPAIKSAKTIALCGSTLEHSTSTGTSITALLMVVEWAMTRRTA